MLGCFLSYCLVSRGRLAASRWKVNALDIGLRRKAVNERLSTNEIYVSVRWLASFAVQNPFSPKDIYSGC